MRNEKRRTARHTNGKTEVPSISNATTAAVAACDIWLLVTVAAFAEKRNWYLIAYEVAEVVVFDSAVRKYVHILHSV